MSSSTRSVPSCPTRNATASRVAASAQWRSSRTNSTGRISASRWSTPRIASRRRGARNSVELAGSGAGRAPGRAGRDPPATPRTRSIDGGRLEPADERAERLDDRAVGDAALADVRAAALSTRKPRAAASEDVSRTAATCRRPPRPQRAGGRACRRGAVERGIKRGHLRGAPDERRADEASGHARIIGRGGNRCSRTWVWNFARDASVDTAYATAVSTS